MEKPTKEQLAAYEIKKKEWNGIMDKIKPKPIDYGYRPSGLEEEGGWVIEGGEEAYKKALSEWDMKRSCDAPNPPGYYRANND
jgi:hypothetical protein